MHRRRRSHGCRGGAGLIPEFAVRPAEPRDAAAIGQLAERSEMFPAAMLEGMIAPFLAGGSESRWYVADADGDLIGFLYCDAEMLTDGTQNLKAMATMHEGRRQGVGSALIATLESDLAQSEQRVLLVETSSADEFAATRRFYANRGFREEARIREFWAAGEDKVIFWKAVSPNG